MKIKMEQVQQLGDLTGKYIYKLTVYVYFM